MDQEWFIPDPYKILEFWIQIQPIFLKAYLPRKLFKKNLNSIKNEEFINYLTVSISVFDTTVLQNTQFRIHRSKIKNKNIFIYLLFHPDSTGSESTTLVKRLWIDIEMSRVDIEKSGVRILLQSSTIKIRSIKFFKMVLDTVDYEMQ